MQPVPIYLPSNCQPAYQLNWSLSVFGKFSLPSPAGQIEALRAEVAKGELRILQWLFREPNVAMFFVSSKPGTAPSQIIRSIKARWQYLSRPEKSLEFRRNYRITSVGTSNKEIIDAYVAKQPQRHIMADEKVQATIEQVQFHDPAVDLAATRRSSHGEFIHSLQIVVELEPGGYETRPSVLDMFRKMAIATCSRHQWPLSRIGLLSNHMHLLLGAGINDAPEEIAMALMNNIAWSQGMKPILRFSFYAGTCSRQLALRRNKSGGSGV